MDGPLKWTKTCFEIDQNLTTFRQKPYVFLNFSRLRRLFRLYWSTMVHLTWTKNTFQNSLLVHLTTCGTFKKFGSPKNDHFFRFFCENFIIFLEKNRFFSNKQKHTILLNFQDFCKFFENIIILHVYLLSVFFFSIYYILSSIYWIEIEKK